MDSGATKLGWRAEAAEAKQILWRWLSPIVDAVLPPRCLGCGAMVQDDGGFCAPCWQARHFLRPPACACCAMPFAQPQGDGALCAACMADPPPFTRAGALIAYDAVVGAIILRLKYGRRVGLARAMAQMLIAPAHDLLGTDAPDALVLAVPLDRWRLWRRGFNQSLLIARPLARALGLPLHPDALARVRPTGSMRGLGRRARLRRVQGAFVVPDRHRDDIRGRAILLVDDVMTTGATLSACARALRRAGAARVYVLTFARVVDVGGH